MDLLRDPEVVELVRSIPVQEAGRVKPLDTVARFRLLRFSGKTTIPMVDAEGKKTTLNDMEWLLVSWFRPDLAKDLPVFVVDNSDAIVEIGLSGKEKRDRYSYNELLPGRTALVQKRQEVADIETKDRTPVQRILGKLGSDFLDYEMMLGHFDFARSPFGDEVKSVPPEIVPANAPAPRIVPLLKNMTAHIKAHPEAGAPMANPWLRNFYFHSMLGAMMAGNAEQTLRIFPTNDPTTEVWQGPGTIMMHVQADRRSQKRQLQGSSNSAPLKRGSPSMKTGILRQVMRRRSRPSCIPWWTTSTRLSCQRWCRP